MANCPFVDGPIYLSLEKPDAASARPPSYLDKAA